MRKIDKKMKALFVLGILSIYWQSSPFAMEEKYQERPQQMTLTNRENKQFVWGFPNGITGHIFAGDIDVEAGDLEKTADDYVKRIRVGVDISPTTYGKIADTYLYAALNAVDIRTMVRNCRKAVEYAEIYLEDEQDDHHVESAEGRLEYLLANFSEMLESDTVNPLSQLHLSPEVLFRISDCQAQQENGYTLKRSAELDGCPENYVFFIEDIFYSISAYLNFADRLTKLGALCSTFRYWSIKIITEFSDKLESDTRFYPFYNPWLQDFFGGYNHWDEEKDLNDIPYKLTRLSTDEYILFGSQNVDEKYIARNLLTKEYRADRNIILKPIPIVKEFADIMEGWCYKNQYPQLKKAVGFFQIKDSKNKYYLFPRSREELKYIPLEYGRILKDEDDGNHDERRENVLSVDKNNVISLFGYCIEYLSDTFRFASLFDYNRDQSLKVFTNLQKLDLQENYLITDASVQHLTNLTELDLQENKLITDASVQHLTNLTELNLQYNKLITDASVQHLTNLTKLNLVNNKDITDASLKYLINLQELDLGRRACFFGGKELGPIKNENISGKSLIYLTNLTSLTLVISKDSKSAIFGPVLEHLPRLNGLTLAIEAPFNHENLFSLTNLTRLETDWRIEEDKQRQGKDQYGYNFNIIESELWKRLPKLELYWNNWGPNHEIRPKYWQTRDQFLHEQELRKNFVEKIKQENPYYSCMEIENQ
ncbi:MAG: leucine-rich repeat domain-containing protein [Candidatus Paracaedibacter sp.]